MRLLIVAAGAALGLSACGSDDQAGNTANVDATMTAENITTNDVTAIDAVTGAAANMAADVDINFTNDMLDPAGNGSRTAKRPSRSGEAAQPSPRPRPAQPEAPPQTEPANVTENEAD